MGTFAGFFEYGNLGIADDKVEEFITKVRQVFQSGGMMDVDIVQLYGKKIATIRKAEMDSRGMDFCYNYFEDTRWENAGFNRKTNKVRSNKIGWSHFHLAVVAAYVLQEQYTDGPAVAMVDGEPVTAWKYVGWLNYLFHERKHIKNYDMWKLFEAYHDANNKYLDWDNMHIWTDFGDTRYAFISSCEVCAVLNGTDKAIELFEKLEKSDTEKIAFTGMKRVQGFLQQYIDEQKDINDERCADIINEIRLYYTQEGYESAKYEQLFLGLTVSDAPAFVVKGVSEIFNKDFWELWEQVKDVARRKLDVIYGNQEYYVVPIPTEQFFSQSPDDMIPYWENDNMIRFSEELCVWFKDLKQEYDSMSNEEVDIQNMPKYMVKLLEEADDNYYNIFAFSEFFEESMDNVNDVRYQRLWRIFDKMIHDPELMKAGDVIFVPDGPEHENEGLHYWGEQPKRRLKGSWDLINRSEKNNKGRVTLRRYMALVGNKMLRKEVFGF